jgi:hypothetical protein
VKLARYIWALPTTSVGLLLVALALASRGKLRLIDGVIEAHGGLVTLLLKHCVPISGGAEAMTLGHVVVGRSAAALQRTRQHERVHVRQCERWGPAFIPAYLICGLLAMLRGKDAYLDNRFERQAYKEAP